MKAEDKREFNEIMQRALEFYDKELSAGALQLYWDCVKKFSMEDFRMAMSSCLTNPDKGQFMPKPADIIRQLEGSNQNQAAVAWSKVMEAIGRVGPYKDVVFDDPIIHRAISDMGGWIHLCGMTDDDAPFRGNEFEKRYQGYSARNITPDYENVLTGILNLHNQVEDIGFQRESQRPVLIGDEHKAMLVFSGGKNTPLLTIVDKE